MSAIDDMPEDVSDDFIGWNIDDQWPCCTLCADSGWWDLRRGPEGYIAACICMGTLEHQRTFVFFLDDVT